MFSKKIKLSAAMLALTIGTSAYAGGHTPCHGDRVTVLNKVVVSQDQKMTAEVEVARQVIGCLNPGPALVVGVLIRAVNGDQSTLPNGGYITGSFESLDSAGQSVDYRNYIGSYFVVSNYPFSNVMKKLKVDLAGFDQLILDIPN